MLGSGTMRVGGSLTRLRLVVAPNSGPGWGKVASKGISSVYPFTQILILFSSGEERWQDLTNGLAGLFCASLGSLDKRRTTSPALVFRPMGDLPAGRDVYQ